jgi:hypothetical protein
VPANSETGALGIRLDCRALSATAWCAPGRTDHRMVLSNTPDGDVYNHDALPLMPFSYRARYSDAK